MPTKNPDTPIHALHFADIHFGVETYGRYDPATGLNSRLTDFKLSAISCINQAIANGIEIALFAGDAYKSRDPSQTHQRAFAECLRVLTTAGIPVVLLAGNHDIPNTKGKANALEIYDSLGGNLITVFDKPGVTIIQTKLGRQLQIASIPYLTKSAALAEIPGETKTVRAGVDLVAECYEELIINAAIECGLNPDIPTVLMGHFTVTGAQIASTQSGYLINEPQVSKNALIRDEFDYVALGHIHRHQDLNFAAQPPIVYCGSPDRIDFGEHAEQKGAVLVEIARGRSSYKFIESNARRFLNISVDTTKTKSTDPETAFDPTDMILSAISSQKIDDCVVRLNYKVSLESANLLRDAEMRKALRPAFVVVSIQREVVGINDGARLRSSLVTESDDPLAALSAYIDSKKALVDHKDELIARAQELWLELVKNEAK